MSNRETFLDEIVNYQTRILNLIANSKDCAGLIVNKSANTVNDSDFDRVADDFLFTHEFVDSTIQQTAVFVWCEIEVIRAKTVTVKDLLVTVTVACHNDYMKLSRGLYPGRVGNRRDRLALEIDKLLSFNMDFGIGRLSLTKCLTGKLSDKFTARRLEYFVPDFNYRSGVK